MEDKFERFCVMSAVPLFNSLTGSFLAPRFFIYTGVLACSMRSVRTEAWKLTKLSILLLLSDEPVESSGDPLLMLLMLASIFVAIFICRLA